MLAESPWTHCAVIGMCTIRIYDVKHHVYLLGSLYLIVLMASVDAKLHSEVTKKRERLTCVSSLIHAVGGVSAIKSINEGTTSGKRNNWPIRSRCLMTSAVSRLLSPFLIGRMFLREPSWKYSAKLVGS